MFICMLTVLLCFKESKEKKTKKMKKEEYGENKDRNLEEKAFMIFGIISKTK